MESWDSAPPGRTIGVLAPSSTSRYFLLAVLYSRLDFCLREDLRRHSPPPCATPTAPDQYAHAKSKPRVSAARPVLKTRRMQLPQGREELPARCIYLRFSVWSMARQRLQVDASPGTKSQTLDEHRRNATGHRAPQPRPIAVALGPSVRGSQAPGRSGAGSRVAARGKRWHEREGEKIEK